MLKSRHGNNKFIPTNPGTKWRKKYMRQFDEFGNPFLVEVGEEDITESINMWRDSVDINRIIEACTRGNSVLAGKLDISAVANLLNSQGINNTPGTYGDFSNAPNSLIAAYNVIKAAEDGYNSLTADFKANYKDFTDYLLNGSYNEFLTSFKAPTESEVVDNA